MSISYTPVETPIIAMDKPTVMNMDKPTVMNKPTVIDDTMNTFLIMDAPNDANIAAYVELARKKDIGYIVRACEPSYDKKPLENAGLQVVDIPFSDGTPPPTSVVESWLSICETARISRKKAEPRAGIAVHCVAGLGRAPVLVAIALVENGMGPYDAINYIRKRRRGAINAPQLEYIAAYRSAKKPAGCCVIS